MENKAEDEADEFNSIFGNASSDPKVEPSADSSATNKADISKGGDSGEESDEIGIEVAPSVGSAVGSANGNLLKSAVAMPTSADRKNAPAKSDAPGSSPSRRSAGARSSPSPARRRRRSTSASSRSPSPGGRRGSNSKRRANRDEGGIEGKPRVDPLMFKTLGVDDQRSEPGPTVYDIDLDSLEEKPWREVGADITDWFNYGFDEQSWRDYCSAQVRVRVGLSKRGGGKPLPGITNSPGNHPGSGGNQVGVCFDFQNKGFCVRGTSCRWRHVQKETPRGAQGRGVCYDFQNKGFCQRGNNCRWWHVPKEDGSTPIIPPEQVDELRRRAAVQKESDDGRVKNFLRQLPQVSSLLNPAMGGIAGAMLGSAGGTAAHLLQGAAPLLGGRDGERRRDGRERRKRRRRRSRSDSRSRSRSRRRRR